MSPDSWDWLVNGLYWGGAPVASSFRPPGLPLVTTLLSRLSILEALPYLNFAMLGLAGVLLHRLIRLRHSSLVAALAVLIFVSNGSLFGHTRYVMAEIWTLPFLLASALAFARAEEAPRRYLACALLLSVSFLFHYAGAPVGCGLALAVLVYRRGALRSHWLWLALFAVVPLPLAWITFRAVKAESGASVHVIEPLLHLSFGHLGYYIAAAVALIGLAAVPLYLGGFARLLAPGRERLSPWGQAVLFPLASLALFFALAYDWADKRFLYYLFPFAVAVAAEGIAGLLAFARGSRLRAAGATLILGLALLWNRIPYPAGSHTLVALTPRQFLETAHGLRGATVHTASDLWSFDLLTTDGFLAYGAPARFCADPAAHKAAPEIRRLLDSHLGPGVPIALDGNDGGSTAYWVETNRLTLALGRPVEKPATARFILRRLTTPDRRALATLGPFEIFDLEKIEARARQGRRFREKRERQAADSDLQGARRKSP